MHAVLHWQRRWVHVVTCAVLARRWDDVGQGMCACLAWLQVHGHACGGCWWGQWWLRSAAQGACASCVLPCMLRNSCLAGPELGCLAELPALKELHWSGAHYEYAHAVKRAVQPLSASKPWVKVRVWLC